MRSKPCRCGSGEDYSGCCYPRELDGRLDKMPLFCRECRARYPCKKDCEAPLLMDLSVCPMCGCRPVRGEEESPCECGKVRPEVLWAVMIGGGWGPQWEPPHHRAGKETLEKRGGLMRTYGNMPDYDRRKKKAAVDPDRGYPRDWNDWLGD